MPDGSVISVLEIKHFVEANRASHAVYFPNCDGQRRLQMTLDGKKWVLVWRGQLRMKSPGYTSAGGSWSIDQLLVAFVCQQRIQEMLAVQSPMGLFMLWANLR